MRTLIFLFALIFALAAAPASAQIITPEGPFSGTNENAPESETDYYIATTDPAGNCQTLQIEARSLTQALQIAEDFCPNCSVTDVTAEYKSGYNNPLARPPVQYCPLK